MIGRRRFAAGLAAAGAAATFGARARAARPSYDGRAMLTRKIPRTGEELPVIGLGTWQTFDVGADAAARGPLAEVLEAFLASGGRVIDSSPMYGTSEQVVGDLLAAIRARHPFVATKIWTRGKAEGEAQLAESMRRLRVPRLDLGQVHNLLDAEAHLETLRARKAAGLVRYIGVTHYTTASFADLDRWIRKERLDFVQLPYSVAVRAAEGRLLPAAADTGTAVLVNRPFEEGALFARVRGKPLPDWAASLGCTAWSQVFLKFILANPAVTCVIPATAKPKHLEENVAAGSGPLPDRALLKKIVEAVG